MYPAFTLFTRALTTYFTFSIAVNTAELAHSVKQLNNSINFYSVMNPKKEEKMG